MSPFQDWLDLIAPSVPRRRVLGRGESLFRQGDPADAVFGVETGRLRLVRHLADGATVGVHTARGGETFAEAALFAESYHCDAVAETESAVLVLPKPDLLAALARDPLAALALSRRLARQLQALRARTELRGIRSASERLLAWLRMGADGTPAAVAIDRPWKEIASDLGLSHEALYRTLAELEREGAIRRDGRRVVLRAPDV